jgi:hypothetical protein
MTVGRPVLPHEVVSIALWKTTRNEEPPNDPCRIG